MRERLGGVEVSISIERSEDTCSEVRKVAANHLVDIHAKIANLGAMERVLANAVRCCDVGMLPTVR